MKENKNSFREEQHRRFTEHIDEIYHGLMPYQKYLDINGINEIKENFIKKTSEFFDENRRFNIAVIGQVKAGKSSFLNALLFNTRSILPHAVTPKTSTLTMIEYSKTNSLFIEFYDVYEWAEIKKTARLSFDTPQTEAARDILAMADNSNVSVNECLEMQQKEIKVRKLDELNELLESYVGVSGDYTPYVKNVRLGVNIPIIKDITIVDTPGLNDPVPSRRIKTQEFIERCDAAFFLSRAGYFLNSDDVDLISSQLPQKGIKKLVLVGSQYDNVLMDAMREGDDYKTVDADLKAQLTKRAGQCIDKMMESLSDAGCSAEVIKVVSECRTPYYISSMAKEMAVNYKSNDYSKLATHVLKKLSEFTELNMETLVEISGFNAVNNLFTEMLEQKNELLNSKAASFVVVANSELKQLLYNLSNELIAEKNELSNNTLEKQKREIAAINDTINDIKNKINIIFESVYSDVEQNSYSSATLLFNSREKIKPSVNTGVEVVNIGIDVSDKVWWNPFSWKKTHKEYITQQKTYEYSRVKDVFDEIQFIEDSAAKLYGSLEKELLFSSFLREQLIKELLPFANENEINIESVLSSSFGRLIFPSLSLDFTAEKKELKSKFSNDIINDEEATELIIYSEKLVRSMLDDINENLLKNIRSFVDSTKKASEHLANAMLKKEYEKRTIVMSEYDEALKSLQNRQEAIELISNYL